VTPSKCWAGPVPRLKLEGVDNTAVNCTPLHRMASLPNGDLLLARGRKGVQILRYLGVR
jgi:hypothetical protein